MEFVITGPVVGGASGRPGLHILAVHNTAIDTLNGFHQRPAKVPTALPRDPQSVRLAAEGVLANFPPGPQHPLAQPAKMREPFHITDLGDHRQRKHALGPPIHQYRSATRQCLDLFCISRRHRERFDSLSITPKNFIHVHDLPTRQRRADLQTARTIGNGFFQPSKMMRPPARLAGTPGTGRANRCAASIRSGAEMWH